MTPSPLPLPSRANTTAATTTPQPTAVTVVQNPDPVPLTDHLQGWGTVAAVLLALALAAVETIRRRKDQAEAKAERAKDHEEAEKRLQEERAAGDKRLQQQLSEQRDRDRCRFVAEQLQKAANIWAHGEIHLLPGVLVAIPDQYATILRYLVTGEDYNNISGFPPMSETSDQALRRQLTARGLEYHGREDYLAKKLHEQRQKLAAEGKGSSWAKMHPRDVELSRAGWDHTKVKQAWLYEEIGENIADVLGALETGKAEQEEGQRG